VISQSRSQLGPPLKETFEGLARAPVDLFAASDQQRLVGGLLGEGMLEDVLADLSTDT